MCDFVQHLCLLKKASAVLRDAGKFRGVGAPLWEAEAQDKDKPASGESQPYLGISFNGFTNPEYGVKVLTMNETMHEYVIRNLETAKYRWPAVARGADVSKRTLEKIARREIVDPGVSKIQKLHDYFRAKESS
jgi:hypothetical protein